MVGRVSLTPGRLVALLGLVVVLGGLRLRAPDAALQWVALGPAARSGVLVAASVLLLACFRPERGRRLDLAGGAVEQMAAWGAVALAIGRFTSDQGGGTGALVVGAGAGLLLVGASWDLVAAWRAPDGAGTPERAP
jgi:hypothetical protein